MHSEGFGKFDISMTIASDQAFKGICMTEI